MPPQQLGNRSQRSGERRGFGGSGLRCSEARRLAQSARQRRKEEERIRLVALSIIEALGEESVRFLLKNLGRVDRWEIIDKLESEFCKAHPAPREDSSVGALVAKFEAERKPVAEGMA